MRIKINCLKYVVQSVIPALLFLLPGSLVAANVSEVTGQGNNDWNASAAWGSTPSSGNNYITTTAAGSGQGSIFGLTGIAGRIRCNDLSGSPYVNPNVFGGGTLTLSAGTDLLLKQTNGESASVNLILDGGVVYLANNLGGGTSTLGGTITNADNSYIVLNENNGNDPNSTLLTVLNITSSLTGSNNLTLISGAAAIKSGCTNLTIKFSGNLSAFGGTLTVGNAATSNEVLELDPSSTSMPALSLAVLSDTTLQLDNAITVASLSIVQTVSGVYQVVPAGTYTPSQLAALGFGGTFRGSGSVTIPSGFCRAYVDIFMNVYNATFYISNSPSMGTYNSGFWTEAEIIETAVDAYERNPTGAYKNIMTNLLNQFESSSGAGEGTNWSWDTYNDDVMWAVLANIRGYNDSGIALFKNCAKWNFDMAYARGYDTINGGMWWTTAKASKNTCVNCPAAIAAYLLYQALGDSTYLTRAQNIMTWTKTNLWNASTGQVYDNISSNGVVNTGATTYNQGTFCGASSYLGDTNTARLVADFTMSHLGSTNINSGGYILLAQYALDTDDSGFDSICIRWLAKYMKTWNMQSRYLPWLQTNAQTAWNIRSTSDNLSWCEWHTNTPAGVTLSAWDCVDSITALQDIPPVR